MQNRNRKWGDKSLKFGTSFGGQPLNRRLLFKVFILGEITFYVQIRYDIEGLGDGIIVGAMLEVLGC